MFTSSNVQEEFFYTHKPINRWLAGLMCQNYLITLNFFLSYFLHRTWVGFVWKISIPKIQLINLHLKRNQSEYFIYGLHLNHSTPMIIFMTHNQCLKNRCSIFYRWFTANRCEWHVFSIEKAISASDKSVLLEWARN